MARGHAVEGVEETGDAVEEAAGARVNGHIIEGSYGEDDSGVTCSKWPCQLSCLQGPPEIGEV